MFCHRKWQPIPVFLTGKFQGQRSLVGYSPWGQKELDMTEQLHFTSLPLLCLSVATPLASPPQKDDHKAWVWADPGRGNSEVQVPRPQSKSGGSQGKTLGKTNEASGVQNLRGRLLLRVTKDLTLVLAALYVLWWACSLCPHDSSSCVQGHSPRTARVGPFKA